MGPGLVGPIHVWDLLGRLADREVVLAAKEVAQPIAIDLDVRHLCDVVSAHVGFVHACEDLRASARYDTVVLGVGAMEVGEDFVWAEHCQGEIR